MHTIEYLQTFRLKKLKKGVSVPPVSPRRSHTHRRG